MHTVEELLQRISPLTQVQALQEMAHLYPAKVVFSTSFGMEDQLITHFIFKNKIPIDVFTLDTGRLFPETYTTWEQTQLQYNQPIKAYYPNEQHIERYVNQNGINAFYDSVDLRKECCHIRKVEPLSRALAGYSVWVTGLRAEQSPNRGQLAPIEWDKNHQLLKFHPLLHWKTSQVLHELRQNGIPYNPLHDKGFISIGCQPCTRAVKQGEDFRAGRWWWEDKSKKECGLHST